MGRGIITAGNWIVDTVHDIAEWPLKSDLTRILNETQGVGGGAANVATTLARFGIGLPLIPVGAVGDDVLGDFVLNHCRAHGMSTEFITRKADTPTAHTHVMSVRGDSRTFFYHGGAGDLFDDEDVPPVLLSNSGARVFYLGYLLLLASLDKVRPTGGTGARDLLRRARAAGLVTCVDLVSADRPDFAEVVASALPETDYLIINEVEAARASGTVTTGADGAVDPTGLEAAARVLLERGVRKCVVLHSPTLTLWLERNAAVVWAIPRALPSESIVSPVGAGDAFCAGIILAIHEDWSPARALEVANRSAAACLRGHTATESIPRLTELMAAPEQPILKPMTRRSQLGANASSLRPGE